MDAELIIHSDTPNPFPSGPRPLSCTLCWPVGASEEAQQRIFYTGKEFYILSQDRVFRSKVDAVEAAIEIATGRWKAIQVVVREWERQAMIQLLKSVAGLARSLNLTVVSVAGVPKGMDWKEHIDAANQALSKVQGHEACERQSPA